MSELSKILEAILFVAGEPLQIAALATALEVTELEISAAADELASDYDYHRRGICLKRFGTHIQLSTRADYAPQIEKLLQPIQKQSLSQAALETLAVVAYKQPVTRLEIEKIRGVKSDHAISKLLEYDLIYEVGRLDAPGRPALFATTEEFLRRFGIGSKKDLPEVSAEKTAEFKLEAAREVNLDEPREEKAEDPQENVPDGAMKEMPDGD